MRDHKFNRKLHIKKKFILDLSRLIFETVTSGEGNGEKYLKFKIWWCGVLRVTSKYRDYRPLKKQKRGGEGERAKLLSEFVTVMPNQQMKEERAWSISGNWHGMWDELSLEDSIKAPPGQDCMAYQKQGEKGSGRSIANPSPFMISVFIWFNHSWDLVILRGDFVAPWGCKMLFGALPVNAVMAEHSFLLWGVVGWGLVGIFEVCVRYRSK